MKRLMSKIVLVAFLLAMVVTVSVSATSVNSERIAYKMLDENSFIDENGNVQYFCTECPQTRHISHLLHTHHVTNVSAPTYYSVYGGIVSETNGPAVAGERLHGSVEKTVSNSYSVTIDFSASTVSTAVGYNVTESFSKTGAYSSRELNDGEHAVMHYYNVYEKKTFTAITKYYSYINDEAVYMYDETGTGYSLEWSHFSFNVVYS